MGVTVIVFGLLISNAASPVASMTIFRGNAKKVEVKNEKLADDCGRSNPLHIQPNAAGFLQNPGAGIDPFKPFHVVLKSGYRKAACVKDYMYVHGDKFGKGKHDYKLGSLAVSIVHYNDWVPKEDRQEMTPKVCFQFCRSVPDMGFFGILNGRNCYCEPYFKAMAGDSSMCDAVCDGDPTNTCGGESKSVVYSMHACPLQMKPGVAAEALKMKADLLIKKAEEEGAEYVAAESNSKELDDAIVAAKQRAAKAKADAKAAAEAKMAAEKAAAEAKAAGDMAAAKAAALAEKKAEEAAAAAKAAAEKAAADEAAAAEAKRIAEAVAKKEAAEKAAANAAAKKAADEAGKAECKNAAPQGISLDFNDQTRGKCPSGWKCPGKVGGGGWAGVSTMGVCWNGGHNGNCHDLPGNGAKWFYAGNDQDVGEAKSYSFSLPKGIASMSVLRAGMSDWHTKQGSGIFVKREEDDKTLCTANANVAGWRFKEDDTCQGLAPYAGQKVYILAKNAKKGGWGKLFFDDIRFLGADEKVILGSSIPCK